VWHAGSNALALALSKTDVSFGDAGLGTFAAAAAALAVCLWVLCRTRPGGVRLQADPSASGSG
jgi:hypothetical protein